MPLIGAGVVAVQDSPLSARMDTLPPDGSVDDETVTYELNTETRTVRELSRKVKEARY